MNDRLVKLPPEMIEAGRKFVMDFFPAEWGGARGISEHEARAITEGVLLSAFRAKSPEHDSSK